MDYIKGSEIVDAKIVRAKIETVPALATARITLHDGAYLDLNGKLRSFLLECCEGFPLYKVDVNDCDKFVRKLLGRIAEKAEKEDLPEVPCAAWTNHWPLAGDYHAGITALDAGVIWFLEPQRWHDMELCRIEDHVRQAVEIWG